MAITYADGFALVNVVMANFWRRAGHADGAAEADDGQGEQLSRAKPVSREWGTAAN